MNEMNWDDIRLFLAVAEHQGLSGASRATGLSTPTLGRRMLALEATLGRELFRRHARGYDLTQDGVDLFEQTRGLAPQFQGITAQDPQHIIKISAGIWTTRWLCRHVRELSDGTTILRFVAANDVLDMTHREAVIGIRNHRPDQTNLAARRVGVVRFAAYRAKSAQDTKDAKDGLPFVQVLGETPSARWVKDQGPSPFEVTHPTHALDLAISGVGKVVLPTFIGDAIHNLHRDGPVIDALTHEQWLVSHETDRFLPHVRTCLDRLARLLRSQSSGTSMS